MTEAPARSTGAEQVVWDLSVLYSGIDDPQIAQDTEAVKAMTQAFVAAYRGKVATLTAAQFVQAYHEMEALYDLMLKQTTYASLNFSTFSTDPQWGGFLQKMQEFASQIQQQLVFFELEWNALDDDHAARILADPALGGYRYHLEVARLNKPYQLSEVEEQLLLEKSVTGSSAWTRFFDQLMGALRVAWEGAQLPLQQALTRLYDNDRSVRARAQQAITDALAAKKMELTYIFNVLAADKASDDKRRGYPSWITPRNISNKAPDSVVNALIQAVTANYALVARHYRLKRALLGLDELFDYDRYAPLNLKDSDKFYTWEEARGIVLNAFQRFSPRMAMVAAKFFDENWIHAPIILGKRGGAYASYGTKSTHPFVFVNYDGKARDVETLAHELGHGVHMYLAKEAQPLTSMFTPLTTAEMASTFAEMVVFDDLMARESDREAQLAMLVGKVEGSFATIFRQIAMNRFEDAMHTARRSEGELTTERLNALWLETQRAMFGDSVTMTDNYGLWWSYIPHMLHTPGYVYAYAFGELLVLALYNIYKQQGESFVPNYEAVLAAGDSDYPDKLLARVGVDLNDPNFWAEGIKLLEALVSQEESLARELYPEKFA